MSLLQISDPSISNDDLKKFDYDGYAFDENLSNGNKLVFTR